MAVSELLRGVGGALAGFLAVLVLALALAETREIGALRQRGINWVAPRSHLVQFAPIWHPVIACGLPAALIGYLMGTRLTSARAIRFAAVGMAAGLVVMMVIPGSLEDRYGRAGRNTSLFLLVVGAFLGGCIGAVVAERWHRRPRGRWD
jgi:hypothetical protein